MTDSVLSRMSLEIVDLTEKVEKLDAFLKSEKFVALQQTQLLHTQLLVKQYEHMLQYLRTLQVRFVSMIPPLTGVLVDLKIEE